MESSIKTFISVRYFEKIVIYFMRKFLPESKKVMIGYTRKFLRDYLFVHR